MVDYREFKRSLSHYSSLVFLLLSNISILLFVLFSKATTLEVLLIYWMESAIVGFYNVLKMGTAGSSSDPNEKTVNIIKKVFFIPFFTMHYGIFMVVHFVFIITITKITSTGQSVSVLSNLFTTLKTIAFPVLILLVSHGYSFVYNFLLNKEYKDADVQKLMTQPYSRVMVMHLVIVLGVAASAILTRYFQNLTVQSGIIIFFIALKTIADVNAHIKERKKMKS